MTKKDFKKSLKWKIFGIQTKVEWYDVKTKFKQLIRKITYSKLFQELICWLVFGYLQLIYYSSRKTFINQELLIDAAKNKSPLIISIWHNRLMAIPLITKKPKKLYPQCNLMSLASKHGDGRFVGRVMEKFGLISILGSSNDGRKSSRGIDFADMRKILYGLKNGNSLGITPDGPRGPNQKINGEIINIAKISGAGILATSCSSSRFIELKTWDKFKIPLPFSRLYFCFDDKPIYISKNTEKDELDKIRVDLEERMNLVQKKSDELAL